MPGMRKVCSVLTGVALLYQTLFQPLAGNAQTSNKSLVRICVPADLVRNESWEYPYPGSEIDVFKKLLGEYILSHGNPQVQYRIKQDAFETFKRARRASNPYTPDPRNLLQEVSAEQACPPSNDTNTLEVPSNQGSSNTPNSVVVGLAAIAVAELMAKKDAVQPTCDQLASSPFDRDKVGNGVALNAINVSEALPACQQAIEKQPTTARDRYLYGRVLTAAKRYDEAAAQFDAADRAGSAMGTYYLASACETGLGRRKNVNEAVRLYRKAGDAGIADAYAKLGWLYEFGLGVPKDRAAGASFYSEAAKGRDPLGTFRLGLMYRDGTEGMQRNLETACQLFLQAAKDGNSYAQGEIGICYYTGQGMPRNDEAAFAWFLHAAEAGVTRAQEFVGEMYEHGEGVAQSDANAVEWYRTAAMKGDPYGMFRLGAHLREGMGVAWNEAEAMQWFQKGASLGEVASMTSLGMGYERGLGGGRQDYALAARWYGEAARHQALTPDQEFSVTWAQVSLGNLYEKGWGVTPDSDEARRLYMQAAESRSPTVAQMARQYLAKMSATSRRTPPVASKSSSDILPTLVVGGLSMLAISWMLHSDSSSSGSRDHFNWSPETSYEDQVMRRMQVGCLWDEASFINYGTCM